MSDHGGNDVVHVAGEEEDAVHALVFFGFSGGIRSNECYSSI